MTSVDTRIGLYGKLPSHPDFIRLNAGGILAVEFDHWIHEGLVSGRENGGPEWESRFDDSPLFGFVFRGSLPQNALMGLSRPGRDQSDRRYPFSVFVQEALDRRGRTLHVLPVSHSRFLSSVAHRIAVDDMPFDESGFEQSALLLPPSSSEADNLFKVYFASLTMGMFWEGIFGDFGDPRKYLVINNLFQLLVPYRGQDPSGDRRIIRLPVGSDLERASRQVSAWLALMAGVVGADGMVKSSVFWRVPSSGLIGGECLVTLRPPDDFLWAYLFLGDGRSIRLWDTEQSQSDQSASPRTLLGDSIANALDTEDLLLREFIEQF